MIDLKFILKNGKQILHWRKLLLDVHYLPIPGEGWGHDVLCLRPPTKLGEEKNWSEWEVVPTEMAPEDTHGKN